MQSDHYETGSKTSNLQDPALPGIMFSGTAASLSALPESQVIKCMMEFHEHGVYLLQNVMPDISEFEVFTKGVCDRFYTVSSKHLRNMVPGDGYSNEVARDNHVLLGHTEGTFRPYPPSPEVCFFLCMDPPEFPGGETTLVDGEIFLKHIPVKIRERFERSGIIYEMTWNIERWRQEFSITGIEELDTILSSIKGVEYEINDDFLRLFYSTHAITSDRKGNQVFAVSMLGHLPEITHPAYKDKKVHVVPTNRVYFGDGEEISQETVNELIDIYDLLTYRHSWQKGDVLLVDNTRYLHGRRMTVKDCNRRIISRFGWLKKEYALMYQSDLSVP